MKFLKHLWFSTASVVAFICVAAGTKRDENSMSTIFTAYPGNLFKRKLIISIGHLQRSFPFKCLRIAEIHQNSDRWKNYTNIVFFFLLRRLYISEGWSAMQQLILPRSSYEYSSALGTRKDLLGYKDHNVITPTTP